MSLMSGAALVLQLCRCQQPWTSIC